MKTYKRRVIFMVVMWLSLGVGLSYAQDDDRKELGTASSEQDVLDDLLKPPGASLQLTADGGWQLFGFGVGTYDFNDPSDIQDAYTEGQLKAKANIAKFLNEHLESEELLNILSEKRKDLVQGEDASVSKKVVTTIVQNIKSSANEILQGVIVLETIKVTTQPCKLFHGAC